jgi:hypothetical protein
VVDEAHPLCGERLKAVSFRRVRGELRLVVVLPDGTPGMVTAGATDVFGARQAPPSARPVTTLSVEGVRVLRSRVGRSGGSPRSGRQPWKVVRHARGVDPFDRLEWVYSAHTTERAALRARSRVRAVMARASGEAEAARWVWSVVQDPDGSLTNPVVPRRPHEVDVDGGGRGGV